MAAYLVPCQGCHKGLYPLERMKLNDAVFHKTGCAKCFTCRTNLTVNNFTVVGNTFYCKTHYLANFSKAGGQYSFAPPSSSCLNESSELPPPPPIASGPSKLSMFLASGNSSNKSESISTTTMQSQERKLPPPPATVERKFTTTTTTATPVLPSRLNTFLESTTALKDLRLLSQQQQQQSASKPNVPTAISMGFSLKERMKAYTAAARSSSTSGKPVTAENRVAKTPGATSGNKAREEELERESGKRFAKTLLVENNTHEEKVPPVAAAIVSAPIPSQRIEGFKQAVFSKSSEAREVMQKRQKLAKPKDPISKKVDDSESWRNLRSICKGTQEQLRSVCGGQAATESAVNELDQLLNSFIARIESKC